MRRFLSSILIAGMLFTGCGSGENPPPAAKDLLEAMNRFSEAIKICRTSAIENELKNLGQHIKTFREHPDKDLKSALFAKIIDTIESGYGDLISGSVGRTEIIRWCMKKGFWQQAMTLCSEWLPLELVERKICAPRDSVIKSEAESKARSQRKTWQQYFIIDYRVAEKSAEAFEKDFCNEVREALENFPAEKPDDEEDFVKLKNFLEEFAADKISFEECRSGKILVNAFKRRCPLLAEVLQAIYDERRSHPHYRKNFYQFLQTVEHAKILKLIANFPADKILKLFKTEREEIPQKELEPDEKFERARKNREREYRRMFAKKIMLSVLDTKVALKFLSGYHDIRYERNQVNHANPQASKTISELKSMIEDYLAELEKIPADKKNAAALLRNG